MRRRPDHGTTQRQENRNTDAIQTGNHGLNKIQNATSIAIKYQKPIFCTSTKRQK
jgi:hypothetical protein